MLVAACCSKANAACAAAARRHAAAPHGPAAPQVKAYRAPAFLATHWVNAFESADGRFLYLDAVVTDTPALMSHWKLDTGSAAADVLTQPCHEP